MEYKWMFIALGVLFAAMSAKDAVVSHNETECTKAYSQSNKTADEIRKICISKP